MSSNNRSRRENKSPVSKRRNGEKRQSLSPRAIPVQERAPLPREPERPKQDEEKEKPNYSTSGALVKDVNSYNGITLKYAEPPEARKSNKKLRLYIFKGKDLLDTIPIYKQSAYLIGRERKVCDLPQEHPSISSQHCVLQYRQTISTNEYGETKRKTRLYIIDLESSNGTMVNNEKIPPSRYYEIKVGDVIKLAFSTRELVVMDEDAAN